ncbi:MAG TPA: hypothetical protein VFT99_06065, partial [Roseiflexaceae bacterium]|nr:hypothetical protein [Roseiflexaceae bacterium]
MPSRPKIPVALLISLLAGWLAACGTPTATTPPTAAAPTSASAATEAPTTAAAATTAPAATAAPAEEATAAPAPTPRPATGGKTTITIYTTSDTNITDWLQNSVIPAFTAKYPQYDVQMIDAGDAGTDPIIQRAMAAMETGGDPQVELMEGDPRNYKPAVDAGLWYK